MQPNLFSPEGLLLCTMGVKQAGKYFDAFNRFATSQHVYGSRGALQKQIHGLLKSGNDSALLNYYSHRPDVLDSLTKARAHAAATNNPSYLNGIYNEVSQSLAGLGANPASKAGWRNKSMLGGMALAGIPAWGIGTTLGYGNGVEDGVRQGTSKGISYGMGQMTKGMQELNPLERIYGGFQFAVSPESYAKTMRDRVFSKNTGLTFDESAYGMGTAGDAAGFSGFKNNVSSSVEGKLNYKDTLNTPFGLRLWNTVTGAGRTPETPY